MHPLDKAIHLTRRDFFTSAASGLGLLALSSMLQRDGLLAAPGPADPLAPRAPHFAPRAKNCIFIFMEGAPSQIDLFDPKPKLNELNGQPLPESMTKNVRFAFIKKETARLMGSPRKFAKHGQCGMEFSDLLPHMATCADDLLMVRSMHTDQFNHHPAQLVMHCGRAAFGLPTMGAWLNYGLGSESRNLPGYVVLSAGRGTSGGASLYQSGFLPSVYAGVQFRSQGAAVLNLENPAGLPPELQRAGLDTLAGLNEARFEQMRDPEIQSRIAAYELAFRMQSAAPELIDLSKEDPKTLEAYGVHREDLKVRGLLDETLIVWCGEFGRTPLGENRGGSKNVTGRDHHPSAFTILMAGGGIKGGQIYGETDEIGWSVVRDPVHINDLHATILHQFGIDHLRLTHRFQGRDFRLTDVAGKVVKPWIA